MGIYSAISSILHIHCANYKSDTRWRSKRRPKWMWMSLKRTSGLYSQSALETRAVHWKHHNLWPFLNEAHIYLLWLGFAWNPALLCFYYLASTRLLGSLQNPTMTSYEKPMDKFFQLVFSHTKRSEKCERHRFDQTILKSSCLKGFIRASFPPHH